MNYLITIKISRNVIKNVKILVIIEHIFKKQGLLIDKQRIAAKKANLPSIYLQIINSILVSISLNY